MLCQQTVITNSYNSGVDTINLIGLIVTYFCFNFFFFEVTISCQKVRFSGYVGANIISLFILLIASYFTQIL